MKWFNPDETKVLICLLNSCNIFCPCLIYMKAIWNHQIIAESNDTIVVENNHYFPPGSLQHGLLKPSATHSTCPWKGEASYYTIEVNGQANKDAAWYYPAPKTAAAQIKDYVAFWKGVQISE